MLNEERTDSAKLFHFAIFVAVNGINCIIIPFILDYAHNFLNGVLIPDTLRWNDNNRLRTDQTGWYTAQVIVVIVEFTGLLWLLYRFNQRNTRIWLSQELILVTRSVTWFIVAVVAIVTLFGRGGFLIWLVKQYIKTVV